MNSFSRQSIGYLFCVGTLLCLLAASSAEAGQGCPFDDGSCQTYCNQQGCNLGYCGHFAWIQCICRKCGDEWNWYDKVHYNPDKQVNQTELDSLKLNGSAPIILTNNNEQRTAGAQKLQPQASGNQQGQPAAQQQVVVESVRKAAVEPAPTSGSAASREAKASKGATLTTLLIPDLSDSSKLDLNDIPEENSEKFLDFLAKNHEKLAQATGAKQPGEQQSQGEGEGEGEGEPEPSDEDTVEIQISSSNNQQPAATSARAADDVGSAASAASTPIVTSGTEEEPEEDEQQEQQQARRSSGRSVTRLLRMAAHERLADDLYSIEAR